MDFSFLTQDTALLIAHLFGVALGAGGAYSSDILFLASAHDRHLSKTELHLVRVASMSVTVGLVILIISGIGLALLDLEHYLASSKFLAKMSIVGILALNGIAFHKVHIPRLKRYTQGTFPSRPVLRKEQTLLMLSGVVSFISWSTTLLLGMIKSIPWSYEVIMLAYLGILGATFFATYTMRSFVLPPLK